MNGGDFACYSPFNKSAHINPLYSYVFEGWVKTEGLQNSAAIISINLVNSKRQSVQRYLSQPITGTWSEWQKIQIDPILPRDDVSFVFIGLHVVNQRTKDIRGTVWFDSLHWQNRGCPPATTSTLTSKTSVVVMNNRSM
ncbi:MAG: hypothetical protein R3C11_02450 [Planctomycetaceae bacterium]